MISIRHSQADQVRQADTPSSSSPPKASEYAVTTTHRRSALENPRSCWAEGRAMFMIVAPSTTINCAVHMTNSVRPK